MSKLQPRALRNCNPGNIRLSSERFMGERSPSRDGSFKEFVNMAYGYRAIFVVLNTYRKKYGISTIEGMISRWAPPSENDTHRYTSWVTERTELNSQILIDTLSAEQMLPIVEAIAIMESGEQVDMEELKGGWQLFLESQL